ncbi:unnamed protein product [Amoebophrya sp. A120]|nr:unnamed protein product [Amoebophrya sp. A120]|eukprot:GSA120T00003411001.1
MEQHQVHVWENTYQMEPKHEQKFLPSKVTEIIDEVMTKKLADREYDPDMAKTWTLELCNEIKAAVKAHGSIPRHKIICQVVIGEAAGQGMRVVSKCLWDVNVDNWASFSFKSPTMFAVGMVFGCYYE